MRHVTDLDERHFGLLSLLVALWIVWYLIGREIGKAGIVIAAVIAVVMAAFDPWLGAGALQWVIAAAIGARR